MFLLDTNIVSELRRARPPGAVLAWLEAQEDADLYLSAVTLGEIQAGIEITRTQDPLRAAQIEAWADELASVWNLLSADVAISRLWEKLMHHQPDHLYEDALIESTRLEERNVGQECAPPISPRLRACLAGSAGGCRPLPFGGYLGRDSGRHRDYADAGSTSGGADRSLG